MVFDQSIERQGRKISSFKNAQPGGGHIQWAHPWALSFNHVKTKHCKQSIFCGGLIKILLGHYYVSVILRLSQQCPYRTTNSIQFCLHFQYKKIHHIFIRTFGCFFVAYQIFIRPFFGKGPPLDLYYQEITRSLFFLITNNFNQTVTRPKET